MLLVGLWVLRILIIMIVLRLLVRAATGQRRAAKRRSVPRSAPAERLGGTLVRDPQCGTYIPAAKALTLGKGADVLHFCSVACKETWAAGHRRS